MTDLTIDDIPEAADAELCEVIAQWLGAQCRVCDGKGCRVTRHRPLGDEVIMPCSDCRDGVPTFEGDGAAWRLLDVVREHERVDLSGRSIAVSFAPRGASVYDFDKRGLREAAAHLALLEEG